MSQAITISSKAIEVDIKMKHDEGIKLLRKGFILYVTTSFDGMYYNYSDVQRIKYEGGYLEITGSIFPNGTLYIPHRNVDMSPLITARMNYLQGKKRNASGELTQTQKMLIRLEARLAQIEDMIRYAPGGPEFIGAEQRFEQNADQLKRGDKSINSSDE